MLDVIGQVADNKNPTLSHLQVINSFPLHFLGHCDPVTKNREPKFNPGITPYISNEVGMFVDTTFTDLNNDPRNAVAGGKKADLHVLKSSQGVEDDGTRVAFPNDRAQSIRPTERGKNYK